MRIHTLFVASLLTLSLAAQDDPSARWRIGLGLGAGSLEFDDDVLGRDSNSAGAFRLGFEGTSRRGFGGGLRLESFAAEDLEFGAGPSDYEAGFGSLFGHFTYRVHGHRFAMPVRVGMLANALTLDNTTSAINDEFTYTTIGLQAEIAPEFTLARRGSTEWTLFGEVGLGGGSTMIEFGDTEEEWDSSTVFTGLEFGTRVYLGLCELSLSYIGRWQSMDTSDRGELGAPEVPAYDASFNGLMFGVAVVF